MPDPPGRRRPGSRPVRPAHALTDRMRGSAVQARRTTQFGHVCRRWRVGPRELLSSPVKVCVVGSGGRAHAGHVLARSGHDVVVTPATPGSPVHAGAARGARRRPVRHRPRGPAGRRPRRSAAGPGHARLRPRCGRRPARGLEGLDEGRARSRPACRRRATARSPRPSGPSPSSTPWGISSSSRPTAWPPARACSSPRIGPRPRPTSGPSWPGTRFGDAGRTVVIEEGPHRPRAVGPGRL